MKIEKIHLNKIKVTFTPDDLIEHNLSVSAVKDNAPWVQKVLMSVVFNEVIGCKGNLYFV